MSKSKIYVDDVLVEPFTFSGGERHLSIPEETETETEMYCDIKAILWDSDGIMDLLLVCDAIKRKGIIINSILIPYLPYARQDRVCNKNEPHSLCVMAGLINSIGARSICIVDAHSSVAEALIHNYRAITVMDIFKRSNLELGNHYDVIIAPDAGAEKKVGEVGRYFELPVEVARKVRDTKTGEIVKTAINPETDLNDKKILIIDDICDGGRTFIELSKVIKDLYTPKRIDLYVTHGIFSKGTNVLKPHFDAVLCTKEDLTIERKV
jgi:ribose-phosphate pyrophosphokinase